MDTTEGSLAYTDEQLADRNVKFTNEQLADMKAAFTKEQIKQIRIAQSQGLPSPWWFTRYKAQQRIIQRGVRRAAGQPSRGPWFHEGMEEADLSRGDTEGLVSVYQGKRIPTKRKYRRGTGPQGTPPNSRLQALRDGELDPVELDDDELSYGITKCDDGKFGPMAALDADRLPAAIKNKLHKELIKRAEQLMRGNLLGSIKSIAEIATSPSSEDKDRMKAAQYLLERNMGKMPETIDVTTTEKPWQIMFGELDRRATHRAEAERIENVQEAEFVEDMPPDVMHPRQTPPTDIWDD